MGLYRVTRVYTYRREGRLPNVSGPYLRIWSSSNENRCLREPTEAPDSVCRVPIWCYVFIYLPINPSLSLSLSLSYLSIYLSIYIDIHMAMMPISWTYVVFAADSWSFGLSGLGSGDLFRGVRESGAHIDNASSS